LGCRVLLIALSPPARERIVLKNCGGKNTPPIAVGGGGEKGRLF